MFWFLHILAAIVNWPMLLLTAPLHYAVGKVQPDPGKIRVKNS